MSLLLDALKDADGRHNKPTGAAVPGAPRAGTETQVLSILEDPVPGEPPSAAVAQEGPAPRSRAGQVAGEQPARRERAGTTGRQPPAMRRFMLPALLVLTILGIGVGYTYLSGSQDLPKLMPASLPAPVAAVTNDAPKDEAEILADIPADGHVRLEPVLEPAPPPRAEVPPRAEAIAAPALPAPEPAAAQLPPAILTVRSAPSAERAAAAGAPLQRAYAALRSGDLVTAEAGYREALRAEPHQVDAHLGLAVMAQARGDSTVALSHFRAVLESTPDHARAWSGLSDLAGAQELDGMESRLRGLIARRPAPTLQFALGNVLARQSRWAEAQESYFRAASAEPENAEYAFNLAVSLDHLGKRDATVTWYGRALELARSGRPVQFDTVSATQRLAALREIGQ
jgi:Flp pilus assembly protein TadD